MPASARVDALRRGTSTSAGGTGAGPARSPGAASESAASPGCRRRVTPWPDRSGGVNEGAGDAGSGWTTTGATGALRVARTGGTAAGAVADAGVEGIAGTAAGTVAGAGIAGSAGPALAGFRVAG